VQRLASLLADDGGDYRHDGQVGMLDAGLARRPIKDVLRVRRIIDADDNSGHFSSSKTASNLLAYRQYHAD
jgi:hypothetical protein